MRARLLAEPRIHCRLQTEVRGVAPDADGVTVRFASDGAEQHARYDHVVNALWDGRLAVDRTAGVAPPRPWLYRVKHYVRVASPAALTIPSTTIVLGAFGDAVAYANGGLYLSWYPAGMRGASSALSPPAWPLTLDPAKAAEVRDAICAGLTAIIPAVAALPPEAIAASAVKAGIIFAWGQTDIDDPASVLHERHAIGPQTHGRYHTVDTGKLTMAPLFGKLLADRIRQIG